MKILVTDGSTRPALAITRSLGRSGHTVLVAERSSPVLAQTSRFCAGRVRHPDPARDEDGAIDALAEAAERHGVDVVIPVTDITVSLVTRHRHRFEPRCRVPFATAERIALANDKAQLLRTAERLGVPVPRSWHLERPRDPTPADLPFPVVVKPHRSRVRTEQGWLSCGVRHAATAAALEADRSRRAAEEYPLIVQERIEGAGLGVFACYAHGDPVAWFSHRRIREKPPWGGVSVLSESVPVPARARDYAARLLGALEWDGVAMVEFKQDLRDDEPKLMEINPRFWGSLQLAIDAGVDFPVLLLDTVIGGSRREPAGYRCGVRSRWFWGDLDSLLLRLRAPAGTPPPLDGAGRGGALLEWLALWQRNVYYDNPKSYDARPWLFESMEWFRRLA